MAHLKKVSYLHRVSEPSAPGFPFYSTTQRTSSREKRLFARIATALEEFQLKDFRFLTVTTAPWSSQRNRIEILRLAWKELIRRLRRRFGTVEYIAVVEWNAKKDLMHIHALVRSPFIPQQIISQEWEKITGARVTFITSLYLKRHNENGEAELRRDFDFMTEVARKEIVRKVAGYMSKYLSKQQKQKTQKRIWVSRNFSLRWKEVKRLNRIGVDLDRKVGPGRRLWQKKNEVLRGTSVWFRKFRLLKEDDYGFYLGPLVAVPVQKSLLEKIPDKFVAMKRYGGFWLTEREEVWKTLGREVFDEKVPDNWFLDDDFWMELSVALEVVDWRAPPA